MTTRSKKKQLISEIKETISRKRVENTWILFIKESVLDNDNFHIISLPHPAHGYSTKYCLDNLHHKIYEIVTFNEPHRSWFIDDNVKSDGSILMITPINPLFLVLPRLREHCVTKAIPLEDLLSEKGFNKILNFITNLDAVADLKGTQDIKAYKYNEDKTLSWLENKIRKLAIVLRNKNIHVTSGAVSATFVSSNANNDNVDEEFYLKYAYGMVSEYLEEKIAELLEKKFDFNTELVEYVGNKRKSEVDVDDVNKRVKLESKEKSEGVQLSLNNSITETKKPKALTAKEKTRQKAASRTKTISSFFCKK